MASLYWHSPPSLTCLITCDNIVKRSFTMLLRGLRERLVAVLTLFLFFCVVKLHAEESTTIS
jgi:hypothetical protein